MAEFPQIAARLEGVAVEIRPAASVAGLVAHPEER